MYIFIIYNAFLGIGIESILNSFSLWVIYGLTIIWGIRQYLKEALLPKTKQMEDWFIATLKILLVADINDGAKLFGRWLI